MIDDDMVYADVDDDFTGLSFDLTLDKLENENGHELTDGGERWENYIDPIKFRVLFFDKNDKFLFEVNRHHISIVKTDDHFAGNNIECYRVKIPSRDLFIYTEEINAAIKDALIGIWDEEEKTYHGGFKVAVLANWPHFVEGQRHYDETTGDPLMSNEKEPTEDLHFDFGDHISTLSHSIFDNVYGDNRTDPIDKLYRNQAYKHFVKFSAEDGDRGDMGVYTVWVKNFFQEHSEVEEFIRTGKDIKDAGGDASFSYDWQYDESTDSLTCMPYSYHREVDGKKENSYTFEKVWRVWNFSAGAVTNSNAKHRYGYLTGNKKVAKYWEMRNTHWLCRKLDPSFPNTTGSTTIAGGFALDELDIKTDVVYDGNCIKIPAVRTGMTEATAKGLKTSNMSNDELKMGLHFKVLGEGTMRIKARRPEGSNGNIVVISGSDAKAQASLYYNESGVRFEGEYMAQLANKLPKNGLEFILDPGRLQSCDTYIYAVNGDVEIYEVDFIRDYHLYDTGRVGVLPSKNDPIPMYGVQEFGPIGGHIIPNALFNMSDPTNNHPDADSKKVYPYRRVYLIRSVAKVELLFEKTAFHKHLPTHAYLRSLNRSARCEPKDVTTPTEVLWYGYSELDKMMGDSKYEGMITPPPGYKNYAEKYGTDDVTPGGYFSNEQSFRGIDQEFANIKHFGLTYNKNGNLQTYRNRSTWFYGSWLDWGWDWNNTEDGGPYVDTGQIPNDIPFPRVFNSRVDRSSFCRFVYVGETHIDGDARTYYKYILYVPEKNIDDPDAKGDPSKTPKVCHIELHFDDMNESYNMNDEYKYSLYFADYSSDPFDGFARSDFNSMESVNKGTVDGVDTALATYCYPIVRNHVYRFKITSVNKEKLGVETQICTAATRTAPPIVFN